jgi:enterochelin esterase-like enzyme
LRLIILVVAALIPVSVFAQGTVVDTFFYSQSLGFNRNVDVYLPDGYNPDEDVVYPTVYFLHGAGGNNNSYPEIIDTLDALIAAGRIQPVIVVKPDGHIGPFAGSMYTNSELYGNFGDYIIYDLIDFIESSFSVYTDRHYRGIMGHSMGGIGCMKIALAHPELYHAVAALSGSQDLNAGINLWVPHIRAENGNTPPYDYEPLSGTFTLLTYTAAGAFSPNLDNPPYYVDFPLDIDGQVVPDIYERWLPHNPANMVASLPPDPDLAIYFDCGTIDHLEFYPMNVAFAETLDNHGIEYQFQSFYGDHYDPGRLPVALTFLDSVFNAATSIAENVTALPSSITMAYNYPNPFNAMTKIEYQLTESQHIRINIYDIRGQLVETSVDETQSAGAHSLIWNAEQYSSGMYFYKIFGSNRLFTGKMTYLK